jgi:hypothetical protein
MTLRKAEGGNEKQTGWGPFFPLSCFVQQSARILFSKVYDKSNADYSMKQLPY